MSTLDDDRRPGSRLCPHDRVGDLRDCWGGVGHPSESCAADFTDADQLFFDQVRAAAEDDESVSDAARANNLADFSSYLDRRLDDLLIARLDGNEEIVSRAMADREFRAAAEEHLAREIFRRVRERKSDP